MPKFAPSLLAADFLNLQSSIDIITDAGSDYVHYDVMDGYFVPHLSLGTPILDSLKKTKIPPLDIHLMVRNPEQFIPMFLPYKPAVMTFHHESDGYFHSCYSLLKKNGVKVGLAINPDTSVDDAKPYLPMIDVLVIMGVEPGKGGQPFLDKTLKKIVTANDIRLRENLAYEIEVDGGIGYDIGKRCSRAGADILVSGSSFFSSDNPVDFAYKIKG